MVRVLHGVVAKGGGLEVRECGRIDFRLELDEAYVVAGTSPGLVIGMTDEALSLEDLVVSSLVLTRTFCRPGGVRTDVSAIKLFQEIVLVVVGDALGMEVKKVNELYTCIARGTQE